MAIHTDFWVVVGTAAPVIALAAVVSTFDALVIGARTQVEWRPHGGRRFPPGLWPYLGNAAVFLLQLLLFIISLGSLALDRDVAPLGPVLLMEALALFALLWAAAGSARLRWRSVYREAYAKQAEAKQAEAKRNARDRQSDQDPPPSEPGQA